MSTRNITQQKRQSLRKRNFKFKKKSEQGFSLLEAVVGILVVTVILVAITPPIVLSAATRLQNARAEQAIQIAQGEVERVRDLVAQGNYTVSNLPAVAATFSTPNDITSVPAPTTLSTTIKSQNSSCSNPYTYGTQLPDNTALQVDADGNCTPEFLLQTFRDAGSSVTVATNQVVMAFHMGVRVYSVQAVKSGGTLNLVNPAKCSSLKFTTGLGTQQSLPLAVLYTTIARSDATYLSLQQYNQLLSSTAGGTSPGC